MNVLDEKVLILNQSYEPMGTIPVDDAMCKLMNPETSLEVVKWASYELHSANDVWPVPSIMKLNYFVPLRKKRDASLSKRSRIYQRDKFKCQYCGIKAGQYHPEYRKKLSIEDHLTLDHIMPKSRGGATHPRNLVTACFPCNRDKKDRTPEEARMPLLISKTLLNVDLDAISIAEMGRRNPDWKKYLFQCDGDGDERYSHKGDETHL